LHVSWMRVMSHSYWYEVNTNCKSIKSFQVY
jgi:hypothetical protein